jgi:hypothetical protein
MKLLIKLLSSLRRTPPPVTLQLLNQYPVDPLTPDEVYTVTLLCRASDSEAYQLWGRLREKPLARMLYDKIPYRTAVLIDRRVLCAVSSLCDRPATALLWAYTLHRLAERSGLNYEFAMFLDDFSAGYPCMESMRLAWDSQKDQSSCKNYLDQLEYWR